MPIAIPAAVDRDVIASTIASTAGGRRRWPGAIGKRRLRCHRALNQARESGATRPVRGLCRMILVRILFAALVVSDHSAKQADANRPSNRADEVCDVRGLNVQRRLVDVSGS